MPFEFQPTPFADVNLVIPKLFGDERGFFLETYKESEFIAHGINERFVQDNHSRSVRGVLRGLHYQLPPFAQGKLVRCIAGEIWDVLVDIRRSSPTFGVWWGVSLSADNRNMLYIPPGYAHGFYTVSETAEMLYKVTAEYSPSHDRGIRWNDPTIGINWPSTDVIISAKDAIHPGLNEAEVFA